MSQTDEEALAELVRDSEGDMLLALRQGFEAGLRRGRQQSDALARVRCLYSDALSVIAHYPGNETLWIRSKALEALSKTGAAERGEIYAQIDADWSP